VGNFSFVLWAISFWFRHWKNFKNQPTFAKVTVENKNGTVFLTHSVVPGQVTTYYCTFAAGFYVYADSVLRCPMSMSVNTMSFFCDLNNLKLGAVELLHGSSQPNMCLTCSRVKVTNYSHQMLLGRHGSVCP